MIEAVTKKIRICFYTVMPSPYQRELFREIASDENFELLVLYYVSKTQDREWDDICLEVYERVMSGVTLHFLGPSAHWNPDALSHMLAFKPDVVVVSDYSSLTAQFVMRCMGKKGIPFVYWGEVPGFKKRGLIGSVIRSFLQRPLKKASAIAGIGNVAVDSYRLLFKDKLIHNIPYFCDISRFQGKPTCNVPTSDLVILYSGQLIERKGVDLLLEAFYKVGESVPNAKLHLLGGGPLLYKLSQSIPDDFIERIVFFGHIDPVELPNLFWNADIFCLPSRHDGWGVVVNEAIAASLPLVLSDAVGASADLLMDGINGYKVSIGASFVDSLAERLVELCDDEQKRKNFSDASAALSLNYSLKAGVGKWRSLALEVLQQHDNTSGIVF